MLIHEDYFKNIFNTVREAILILDENMRVLSANRSFFTIFKVDAANTIGSLLYDLGNGQWDIPHLRVLLEDILPKNDTVDDYEIEHNFESIGRKTMLLNARKIREKNNDLPIILLAIEDITERKEMEAGLEKTRIELEKTKIAEDEASAFAESVINTVREPLISLDQDLRVVTVSRSFYEFFKVKPEETVGQLIYDLGNKQWDIPKLRELLETILPQKTTFDNYEVEHAFATIGRRTMLLNARQIKRGPGEERIILLAIEDITERKRLEVTERKLSDEKLKEEKTFIENALNAMKDVFFVFDLEGKFLRWNKTLNSVTGYLDREIALMKPVDLFRNDDIRIITEAIQTAVKEGSVTVEALFFTKDGRQIPYDFSASLLRGAHGKPIGISGVGRDLTEHKKLEQQFLQAQKMEAVGTLAGGIAHDFNNILTAIVGYGYMAQITMGPDDPQRANIGHMLEGADRAAHLTKDLLIFSRKEMSEKAPVDLNAIVGIVEKFLVRIIGEDIVCRLALHGEPLVVYADTHQLEQVLMNLATNARDAMPGGGDLIIATEQTTLGDAFVASHEYVKPGRYALLSISDTGEGMDKETCKKIFEPFFTTKEVGKGTGLGLAVAYGIIKQHEGYIYAYSEPGIGTTFKIYLPLITTEARKVEIVPVEEFLIKGTETILLAEDDESVRSLISIVLKQEGYTVIEAVDGIDAVKKFMENRLTIQLIITDLIMPKMNGKEAYDEMKVRRPGLKAIFVSGYAPDAVRQKISLDSDVDLISKPILPYALLKKVRCMLDEDKK
jgi:PAS domain S-box-containing protein